jgi:hypothetical protein
MNGVDYDDPQTDNMWCTERRAEVVAYLGRERLTHGRVGEYPAWHVAPYVSIWAIESLAAPGAVGWWVICGDLPTDYISSADATTPRDAVRCFGASWRVVGARMVAGEETNR